jgi:hypothetical protein
MKLCLIIYSEAADEYVMAELKKAGIQTYTKTVEARGVGMETEPKLGTHFWPGRNNVLFTAVADEEAPKIREQLWKIKRDNPHAGVRGFLLPMEDDV